MRKCRSEFGRKIFSISRAIITTVFAHGAFGFLLAFPIRELLLRFSGIRRGVWSFALPVAIILAVSGCFEIIESIVAEIVAPGKGVQWLGGQGDEWDAQNDMVSAARWFVAYGGCRCVAATDGGSPSLPFSGWERRTRERQ